MARRAIGIDIDSTRIYAVQLLRSRGKLRLERAHTQTIGSGDTSKEAIALRTAEALKSLMREGNFRRNIPVSVAMPHGSVLFQNLETDLPGLDHVRRVLCFELEDDFPLPVDDLVVDICADRVLPDGRKCLLVGAASRTALRERVGALTAASIECEVADVGACAVLAATAANQPAVADKRLILVYVSGSNTILAVADRGSLVTARNLAQPGSQDENVPEGKMSKDALSALVREIELTWRDAFRAPVPASASVVLGGDEETIARLSKALQEQLPCDLTVLNPFAQVTCSDEQRKDARQAIAVGLAAGALAGGNQNANFLAADAFKASQAAGITKGLVFLGMLVGALAGLWVVNLFLQLNGLEARNQDFKTEMRKVFQDTLPEETTIVDELSQLEGRLHALRGEYDAFSSVATSGISPLRILERISANIPAPLNIRISDMAIDSKTVQLKGTAGSFKSVDDLQNCLEAVPEFAAVAIRDVGESRATGMVRFSLLITVATR